MPVEEIASAQNPLIKLVRSLSSRKHRDETGLFVAEGLDHVRKAKAQGFRPSYLLFDRSRAADSELNEIIAWGAGEGARIVALPEALLARVSALSNPQPIVLVGQRKWSPKLEAGAHQVILALDEIRDPGNLGNIMRTAEATAVTRIFLLGDSCDPFSPEAVRASAGSVFAMEITALTRGQFSATARSWPGDIVGTYLAATEDFRQPFRRPVILLMGGESHGLPEELTVACTHLVRIPMAPGVESLNVASATALMLYELQLPSLKR